MSRNEVPRPHAQIHCGMFISYKPDSTKVTAGELAKRIEWPAIGYVSEILIDAEVSAVITTGTAITTSGYTTLTGMFIRNEDDTNFVTVTFDSAANGATPNIVMLLPGQWMFIPDITLASDVTIIADTAACWCRYVMVKT